MASFQNATLQSFNQTLLLNPDLCTLQTCPLTLDGVRLAHFTYLPSLPGNALYAAIFSLFIVLQLFFGIRYRTIGYLVGMTGGLVLEIVGYIARIMMHSNPFLKSSFIMYLCCLTIGPAFLTGAIYLCLSRIVIVYSESAARFRPKVYTFFFIFCDFISLLLQGAGGGIAATANTPSQDSLGKNIMVAGLAWQVISLLIFATACLDLFLRFRNPNTNSTLNATLNPVRTSPRFHYFLYSLAAASIFIFVRSVFRCAELSQGFHGKLANQEITFMVLEGAMIVLTAGLLTASHPGLVMGREAWVAADWFVGRGKTGGRKRWGGKEVASEKNADAESGSGSGSDGGETVGGGEYEYRYGTTVSLA